MSNKFALTILIMALLLNKASVFSQYNEPIELCEGCVLSQNIINDEEKLIVTIDEIPSYEVITRSEADTLRLLLNLQNFTEKTLKMYGIKWFKANLISLESEEHDKFFIRTYYDSDSALQFAPSLTYFRSKNKELVKSVMGADLIGLSQSDMIYHFGEGIRTPSGCGYRYLHSIKDITKNTTNERLYFYVEGGVVTEVAYEKHDNKSTSIAMKSFWGYRPVPEGWLTKGECTASNIKVLDSIPDGKVIGKIGGLGKDNEVMILEIATTGNKFNWSKIVNRKGLTGWVYSKFVRPGIFGTSFEQTLNNSIEYCEWLANHLGKPKSIEKNTDQNGRIASIVKNYDGYKVEYLTSNNADGESFYSIEFTNYGEGHNNRFCGIGIGDDLETANEFANNLLKADAVPYEKGQEFYPNSLLKWVTVDRKAEIIVGTSDGIVSCIIIRKIFD